MVVLSATVGQGHEGAARELAARLTERGVDVTVHDFLDAVPPLSRRLLRDLYRPTVQYTPRLFERLFHDLEHDTVARRVTDGMCRAAEATVARWTRGADVVVSTYPLAGQTLGRLRDADRLPATSVAFLTDPAVHALWCHASVDVHLTVTGATAADARRYGVHASSAGPLCHRDFGRAGRPRAEVRAELGLPERAPVVLLSAGSLGMGAIPRTVRAVRTHPEAHVVVLCGRSEALRHRLSRLPRVVALGWRDDVPDLMGAADIMIHNAGGLSFTEALAAGLPAVTYLPIPGHGRANAALLERAGIAPWPRRPAELVAAVDDAVAAGHGAEVPLRRAWPVGADPADAVATMLRVRREPSAVASGF